MNTLFNERFVWSAIAYIALFCIVLYCLELYFIVLYYALLYFVVMYCADIQIGNNRNDIAWLYIKSTIDLATSNWELRQTKKKVRSESLDEQEKKGMLMSVYLELD
jgi:hypothetical protein